QVQGDLLGGAGGPAGCEDADRAEEHHVDHRPHHDVEKAVRAALQHVRVAPGDRHHPPERGRHGASTSSPRSRNWARCTNTSSSAAGPNRSAIAVAVPSATTRPADRNTTRSQSRSTSTMLWLVTSSAVAYSVLSSRSPVRTRSATSGSSEAVGSSRTS